jgi:hypothetical protein
MAHLGCPAYGATPFHASDVMNLKQSWGPSSVHGSYVWLVSATCMQYAVSFDSSRPYHAGRMHRVSTGSVVALADCPRHSLVHVRVLILRIAFTQIRHSTCSSTRHHGVPKWLVAGMIDSSSTVAGVH